MDWSWFPWVGGAMLAILGGLVAEFYRGASEARDEIQRLLRSFEHCKRSLEVAEKHLRENDTTTALPVLNDSLLDILGPLSERLRVPVSLKLSVEADRAAATASMHFALHISLLEGERDAHEKIEAMLDEGVPARSDVEPLREQELKGLREAVIDLLAVVIGCANIIKTEAATLPPWYQPGEP